MIVRPTPWGRGKSSWGPWNGLDRGIVVRFRRENVFFFWILVTVTTVDV